MSANDPGWPRYIADPETSQARREDDLAVIARIGGYEYRSRADRLHRGHGYSTVADLWQAVDEHVQQTLRNRKASRRAQLPEMAFDWPIYRAALTDPNRCECGDGWLDTSGGCSSEDHDTIMADRQSIPERLEYLRGEIEAERISYGEIAELQSLAEHIDPSDVVLRQWAGIPEAQAKYEARRDAIQRSYADEWPEPLPQDIPEGELRALDGNR